MTDGEFTAILADVSAHGNVSEALREHKVPRTAFYARLLADEDAQNKYARAKKLGCEAVADETFEIADEEPPKVETQFGAHTDAGYVAWQKNRIETRKWHLAKLMPKVYGDKVLLGSDPDNPIPPLVVVGGPKLGDDGG